MILIGTLSSTLGIDAQGAAGAVFHLIKQHAPAAEAAAVEQIVPL